MINLKYRYKRSQSEVITTVLLILVSIIAVVLVSSFVINMVRNNLKGTDCMDTIGQININTEQTYYELGKYLFVSIERDSKKFELTGLVITYGNKYSTKNLELIAGTADADVYFWDKKAEWNNTAMLLPQSGEKISYRINLQAGSKYTDIAGTDRVAITPILSDGQRCDRKVDEKEIENVTS